MDNENGRRPDGTFAPGNQAGKGTPHGNSKAQRLKNLLLDSESDEQFLAVWARIRQAAQDGDIHAAALYLERLLGKAAQSVEVAGPGGDTLVVRLVREKPKAEAPSA